MVLPQTELVMQLARRNGLIRPNDLAASDIPRKYLYQLYERGQLRRLSRGIYVPTDLDLSQNLSLVEAGKHIPHGVICLLSALRFHELGSENPSQVWMAIHPKARRPQLQYPPVRIVRFSGNALSNGVQEHKSPEGIIKVYNPAKTVADCFRYRNKLGLAVALEALQDCRQQRLATMDELRHYAEIDRIWTVMRPYLESIA